MAVYTYDSPDRFVAGTVGEPGQRTFYLQASASGRVTSVVVEKFQVSLLAERIEELLDELLRSTGGQGSVPAAAPAALTDDGPLDLAGVLQARDPDRGAGPAAVPAVRAAAGRRGAHLPAAERPPGDECLTSPKIDRPRGRRAAGGGRGR